MVRRHELKFYVAAERKAWEAFIPVYNAYVLVKLPKGQAIGSFYTVSPLLVW